MLKIFGYKINIFVLLSVLLTLFSAAIVHKLVSLPVLEVENDTLHRELLATNLRLNDMADMLADRDKSLDVHKKLLANVQSELRKTGQSRFQLESAIESATKAANLFNKLNETDKELLAKYSKVYFLNEHYAPQNLSVIDSEFAWQGRSVQTRQDVLPFLQEMLSAMKSAELNPKIVSAYRSFNTQEKLKHTHQVAYGTTEANKFVADQGFSEHQIGTTVDITDTATGGLRGFENTNESKWLMDNAYKYGFVLSYPQNNSYYAYEPWHWRFVGKKLAKHLHDENKYFYDLSQRDINTYLVTIFDK